MSYAWNVGAWGILTPEGKENLKFRSSLSKEWIGLKGILKTEAKFGIQAL